MECAMCTWHNVKSFKEHLHSGVANAVHLFLFAPQPIETVNFLASWQRVDTFVKCFITPQGLIPFRKRGKLWELYYAHLV